MKIFNAFGTLYKNDTRLVFSLVILSFIVRVIWLLNSYNSEYDGVYKIMIAQVWLESPHLIISRFWGVNDWPPMQTYLIALSLLIHNDPVLSPRLINLVFGTITVVPYFYLIRLLFDKKVAVFSCLVLILYPLHVYLSVSSLAEIPFLFFLFLSLYFFFKFKKTGDRETRNVKLLVISAILLNLANMSRYEGWLFIIFLSMFLLYSEKKEYFLLFITISMVFPVFWMIGYYIKTGNPFYFVPTREYLPIKELASHPMMVEARALGPKYMLVGFIVYTLHYLSPLIGFFGFIGVIYSLRRRYRAELAIFLTLLLAIYTFKFLNETARPVHRYTTILGMLLIPYAYMGVGDIRARFRDTKYHYIIAVLLIISIPVIGYKYGTYRADHISPGAPEVAKWLKENTQIDSRVLIDYYDLDGLFILLYGGKLDKGINENVYVMPGPRWMPNRSEILRLLEKGSYLVYCSKGKLQFLNLSPESDIEYRYNRTFKKEYQSGLWSIYSIS